MSDPAAPASPGQAAPAPLTRYHRMRRIWRSPWYRALLGLLSVALVASLANVVWYDAKARQAQADGAGVIQAIVAHGGPAVLVADLQAGIAPLVATPQLAVAISDLDPIDEPDALASLQAALSVYPAGFVHRLADRVALAGHIGFFGDTTVGGFFAPRTVAINCGGDWTPGHRAFVTRTFHHEFSSLVRLAAPLDDAAWLSLNPPGFTYRGPAEFRAMLRSDSPDRGTPELFGQGFARAYGTTDIDNDWNTYAERIFGDGADFARLIRDYPRMQAKTKLFLDTYERMDPRFSEYVTSTGLRAAVSQIR